MMDDAALAGRVALITGASRGIGAAAARVMAAQGAAVVLAARSATAVETIAAEIEADGGRAAALDCDVAEYAAVCRAVDLAKAQFGGLDILVNNAGVIDPIARIEDSYPAAWAQVQAINVTGVYHGIRAALSVMSAGSVIINISSGAAVSALEGWSHYCASKAAVLSLTKCADVELAARGIHVVGLSPGTVATEMQVAIKASGINPVSELDPSVHIPADWVGRAIAWLATEAADAFRGQDVSLRDEDIRRRIGLV
ncbi:MAG: SDR family NAD(P)-dependent oxidoreductase [Pseudomonadota bacterium]